MFEEFSILDSVMNGGITMIVLAIFSVISLAVIIGRAWSLRVFKGELIAGYKRISDKVSRDGVDAAADFCGADKSALAGIYLAGYNKRAYGEDEILRAMELSARLSISGLERYMGSLGTIGSTAPFVGLFGTVLGIMRAFGALAAAGGAGGPSVVAGGIAEALVATAAGLFVAIPAVIAYNYFIRDVSRVAVELESAANDFVAPLSTYGIEGK